MPATDRYRGRGLDPTQDELRLLGKVARMYHQRGINQPKIAADLGLSQARVSRLLRQAVELGIVRTTVVMPDGVHASLEDQIQETYGLRDVLVVDTDGTEADVIPALGAATASYLDVTLTRGHVIGISSWSETLLSAVERMSRKPTSSATCVVQLFGGLGDPSVQILATRLINGLAERTGAEAMFLPAPGLVGNARLRKTMMADGSIREISEAFGRLTDALIGIGTLDPSPLLARSGNAVSAEEREKLRRLGAVGDVCVRYFDAAGQHVESELDQRVIGISTRQLKEIPRRIGVAGGERKFSAIRAAVLGGWVNVLITDVATGERLVEEGEARGGHRAPRGGR